MRNVIFLSLFLAACGSDDGPEVVGESNNSNNSENNSPNNSNNSNNSNSGSNNTNNSVSSNNSTNNAPEPVRLMCSTSLDFENDGTEDFRADYAYDDQNRVARVEQRMVATSTTRALDYVYEDGKLMRMEIDDQIDGSIDGYDEFAYDANGLVTRHASYIADMLQWAMDYAHNGDETNLSYDGNGDGTHDHTEFWRYYDRAAGQFALREEHDAEGNRTRRETFAYDEQARLVTHLYETQLAQSSSKYTYVYEGMTTVRSHDFGLDGTIDEITTSVSGELGPLSQTTKTPDGTLLSSLTFEYLGQTQVVSKSDNDGDGVVDQSQVQTYSLSGCPAL